MSWRPLLEADDRTRALALVRSIAHEVTERLPEDPSLMGTAGIALFLAYAESAGLAEAGRAEAIFVDSLRVASGKCMPVGLWTGCSGLRWMVEHVAEGDEAAGLVRHLDDAVARALTDAPRDVSFDLYSGLAGILLAYAEVDGECGEAIRDAALHRLVALDWGGLRDVPGCAHGFAGVVAALARCADVDARTAALRRGMLVELVGRLIAHGDRGARACWCRGESSIALALLAAARVLGDGALEGQAIQLALAPLQHGDGAGPVDASLCHGTAGVAHMCNRAYQATGEAELGAHARDWLRRTMALHQPGLGVAGFRSRRHRPEPRWENNATLLVGAAGTGLVLLAGATDLEPSWDRLLGIDVEPAPRVQPPRAAASQIAQPTRPRADMRPA